MEDKRYYLRLEYFNYVKDTFNLQLGGGVRFRDGNLVPYLNINSKYTLYEKNKHKSQFLNRFRYYSDGEIENNFEHLFNDVSLVHFFNKKQQINLGLGISSSVEKLEKLYVDYYYLHSSFHHLFYKDWVYYELSPSILKRNINNFRTSYRFLVNFGIYFKSE
ncbi:MAG TPA: hypothetical protein EYG94_06075 [Campylobacterales bacterium]|nr:hypothetical protein [Campylobacterales bacterium]